MITITPTIEYANPGLKALGLPLAHLIDGDLALAEHYAIIGQCLYAQMKGKSLSSYLQGRLPKSVAACQRESKVPVPPSPLDKITAEAWINWLSTFPPVMSAIKKPTTAPPLLHFLAELTRLQDTAALMEAKGAVHLTLTALRDAPPIAPKDCKSAILAFVLPKSTAKDKPRVLLTIELTPRHDAPFNGALGPTENSVIIIATSEFFDQDGQPRGKGSYEIERVTETMGKAWSAAALATWAGFLMDIEARCRTAFDGDLREFPPRIFGAQTAPLSVIVIDCAAVSPGLWSAVYQKLLRGELAAPLVEVALTGAAEPTLVTLDTAPRGRLLGHMDTRDSTGLGRAPAYPLDSTQRLAAIQATVLGDNKKAELLAINGPPGTGKTSFLRAVLATRWVQAAVDKAEAPPIVFGTGATNKAVSNIIDAFGEVPGLQENTMESRWIKGLPSYGWIFPSSAAAKTESCLNLMQIGWHGESRNAYRPQAAAEELMTIPIDQHLATYLERAQQVLKPDAPTMTLTDVLENLHERLTGLVDTLHQEQYKVNDDLARRQAWESLAGRISGNTFAITREVRDLCRDDNLRSRAAKAALLARMDAQQDLAVRIPLFHLAARYWEGRWLEAQLDKSTPTDATTRLKHLMMLGVIVVATTHKLCALGKGVTADLLIMDEAGQCTPEVAVGALAFANNALFVGDTKQLQPIATMTAERAEAIALSVGVGAGELPIALCPNRGSGMAMAQRGSQVTDGMGSAGVTLLYHYRCHPHIIQYCNELLYEGRMQVIRKNAPNVMGMPPISWVAVEGMPQQVGSSWCNIAEIDEIARWIRDSHLRLTGAYQCPLDEILAVITPLAAQAQVAKTRLKQLLGDTVGEAVIDKMIIGTVHKLQGAERPIIAFSLTQNNQANGALFADRDGGFLMNVAVSRAKDCFVVFASRATIKPGPGDATSTELLSQAPVAQLGSYLRRVGTRLYPRALVVVEEVSKIAAIEQALGVNVAVIATKGMLCESRQLPDGTLEWTTASADFTSAIAAHTGFIDDMVIATDDNITGELIGMHAAEVMVNYGKETLAVRRMRCHTMTPEALHTAFVQAGINFDADLLAAGLVREFARHADQLNFQRQLPQQAYLCAEQRDIIAIASTITDATHWQVHAEVQDSQGVTFSAFVPDNTASLAPPKVFASAQAAEIVADHLQAQSLAKTASATIEQIPGLYPPSTTLQILAVAADELHITPWHALAHLDALYQDGAL